MTIAECVIDADFFRKIGSDVEYRDIEELLKFKLTNKEFEVEDYDECRCFIDLIKAVNSCKFKMGVNSGILRDYIKFVKKCPPDIRKIYGIITSKQECFKEITDKLDTRVTDRLFSKTLLESKLNYILVAFFLSPKTIVSTKDEIKTKYEVHCDKLWEIRVNYITACHAKDEIIYNESYVK